MKQKITRATIREKLLKDKKEKSLYLDFYPPVELPNGQTTRRHYLNLRIFAKPKTDNERNHNQITKNKAEKFKNEVISQIYNGTYRSEEFKQVEEENFIPFMQKIIGEYKGTTYQIYKTTINHFKKFYGSEFCPISKINENLVNEFQTYLLSTTEIKHNSANLYLSKFKRILRGLYEAKKIDRNISPNIAFKGKKTQAIKEYLTTEELSKLANTPFNDYPSIKKAFLFSCLTGLRFCDIEKLVWGEIQGNEKEGFCIRFRQKKTGTPETFPLNKQALDIIGDPQSPESRVFADLPNYPQVAIKIKIWIARAGIDKHITFHCARHTFATLHLTYNTDIYTVSSLLGHRDLASTQVYAKIIDSRKREAVDRLPNIMV